jgi:hypothetical protein
MCVCVVAGQIETKTKHFHTIQKNTIRSLFPTHIDFFFPFFSLPITFTTLTLTLTIALLTQAHHTDNAYFVFFFQHTTRITTHFKPNQIFLLIFFSCGTRDAALGDDDRLVLGMSVASPSFSVSRLRF